MFASKNLSSKYVFNCFRAGPLFSPRRPPPPPPSPPPASRRRQTRTRSSRRRPARPSGGRRRRRPASAISRINKCSFFFKKNNPHLKQLQLHRLHPGHLCLPAEVPRVPGEGRAGRISDDKGPLAGEKSVQPPHQTRCSVPGRGEGRGGEGGGRRRLVRHSI